MSMADEEAAVVAIIAHDCAPAKRRRTRSFGTRIAGTSEFSPQASLFGEPLDNSSLERLQISYNFCRCFAVFAARRRGSPRRSLSAT